MMTNRYIVREPASGIEFLSQVHFRFDRAGATHTHAQVQLLFILAGKMLMSVEGVSYSLAAGDVAIVPAKAPHVVPSTDSPANVELLDLRINTRHHGDLGRFAAQTEWPAVVRASPHGIAKAADELSKGVAREGPVRAAAILRGVWSVLTLVADAATSAQSPHADHRIAVAQQFVLEHLTDPIGADDIAAACELSVSQLNRLFRAHTGVAPVQHVRTMRIERARELLATSLLSVKEIAHASGFVCPNHFCRVFKSDVGLTPGDYRDRARRG